jgi:CMP-N,N'-diacetyllegionaminic acid synthase
MIHGNHHQKITLGLVAARKNSIGVKNKNLIKVKKQEITKIATKLALNCSAIHHVLLSSDSIKILNLIKKNKKLTKLKRKKNLAKNSTPMLPVIKDAILHFEKLKKLKVSKLVIFDPTSPLRKMTDIKKAIKIFNKKKPDLLLSVHECEHNPYFSMMEKKGKYYKLSKNSNHNPGSRQQVPDVYEVNTIVWIYSRKAIFSEKRRIPKKTLIFKTPINRSIDIDTKNDINKINFYLKKYEK